MVNKKRFFLLSLFILVGLVSAWDVEITNPVNGSFLNAKNSSDNFYYFNWNLLGTDCLNLGPSDWWFNSVPNNRFSPCGSYQSFSVVQGTTTLEGWNNITLKFTNSSNSSDYKMITSLFWLDDLEPMINISEPYRAITYTNQNSSNVKAQLSENYIKQYNITNELRDIKLTIEGPSLDITKGLINNTLWDFSSLDLDGEYLLTFYAQDKFPDNSTNNEVNKTRIIIRDTVSPSYSILTNQSDNEYAPNKSYSFSIEWNDSLAGINSVWIDFDGTNHTVNSFSNNYNFTISDLAAGNYNYRWYANDSAGNINNTGLFVYNVAKGSTSCTISGENVTYPNPVNITATCNQGQGDLMLFRNEQNVSGENSQLVYLAVGNYTYKVNISETSNYTADSQELNITVSKGISQVYLSINGSESIFSGEFPQNISINSSLLVGGGNISVYLNGSILSNASDNYFEFYNFQVGYYNLTVIYEGNENYTSNSTTLWINVSDITSPEINLINNFVKIYEFESNISFNFNVSDYSNLSSCDLFLNNQYNQTKSLNETLFIGNFTLNNLNSGLYSWIISCKDIYNNEENSSIEFLTVLANLSSNNFTNYTNLTAEINISEVYGFFVSNSFGMIKWLETIDFSSGYDWSSLISITFGLNNWSENATTFYLNESNPAYNYFQNKNATLYFYNVSFNRPEVMKNNITKICSESICYDYNTTTEILAINITGFSEYTVREYIAPAILSSSGGGSGSSSGTCTTQWICTEWSDCLAGVKSRTCSYPVEMCKPLQDKPQENEICTVEIIPLEVQEPESKLSEDQEVIDRNSLITGFAVGEFFSKPLNLIFMVMTLGVLTGLLAFVAVKRKKAKLVNEIYSMYNADSTN